jgi:cyanophycin synthetase
MVLQSGIEKLMPSLYNHHVLKKCPVAFLHVYVRAHGWGTLLNILALELQSLAGMECGFWKNTLCRREKGAYHVVFAYLVGKCRTLCGNAAIRIAEALQKNIPYDISNDIQELIRINKRDGLGPSTISLINESKKKEIFLTVGWMIKH